MTNVCDVTVSVLGFHEDGEWCALALEMDLRGYGQTFDEALEDLSESMTMQIGFAQFKDRTDMIFHPADPVYFSLFAQVRNDRIMALARGGSVGQGGYAAVGLPLPPRPRDCCPKEQFFSVRWLRPIRTASSSESCASMIPGSRCT